MNRRDLLKSAAGAIAALAGKTTVATTTRPASPVGMKIILWCWDSRMTWDDEPEAIVRKMAAPTGEFVYPKKPESYLVGFKRLVDYSASIGVHAIIVWGFLRDAHGGIDAARELCQYASDRGVGIIPGVGLCSYGGYFFQGDHRFNLNTYIRKHPDRAVLVPRPEHADKPAPILDPSLKANQDWWRDGLEWMLETFRIAGVNYEMGDFLVNPSVSARQARAALGFDADENIQDLVVATQELMRFAFAALPKGLFINSTYRGYHQIRHFPQMDYTRGLPEQAVWQYTLTQMIGRPEFPAGFEGAPPHRRYGYLHWFNSSTRTSNKNYVDDIARVFAGAHQLGFEFIGPYGEISAINNPLARTNYEAMTGWKPSG